MARSARTLVVALIRRSGRVDDVRLLRDHLRRRVRRAKVAVVGLTTPRHARRVAQDVPDARIGAFASADVPLRSVVAARRVDPSTTGAGDRHLALVQRCLDAHDIVHRRLPVESLNRHRLAVLDDDRDRVLDALRAEAPPTTYIYADHSATARRRRLVHLPAAGPSRARLLARANVWRVFEFLADPTGRDVLGDLHGCEVEFWTGAVHDKADSDQSGEANRTDQVLAKRWNERVTVLTRSQFGQPDGGAELTSPLITHIDFPVDIVYTWVDGDDPEWRRRQREASRTTPALRRDGEATGAARYTSYDELRYSLRSVERYADFVNHVYVVTDAQRPSFLVDDHPRLTVVDHRDIFDDPGCLPTFNSHAIESRLHHIRGLSEHYVYMNDDFIFGRRVDAATFFHANGLAKFFPSRALVPTGAVGEHTKSVDMAAINGRNLVEQKFGKVPSRKMRHAPYPQIRSVLVDIEQWFPAEVAATNASRVRSATDVSMASFLHHHIAYLTARAVPGSIRTEYVDLGHPHLAARLERLARRANVDAICLNDSDDHGVPVELKRRLVREFLDARYPERSSFERP